MCVGVSNWGSEALIRCEIVYCLCGHANQGHGPGGCGGETKRGAVWHSCKCETFVRAENQERKPNIAHRQGFGIYHAGPGGQQLA